MIVCYPALLLISLVSSCWPSNWKLLVLFHLYFLVKTTIFVLVRLISSSFPYSGNLQIEVVFEECLWPLLEICFVRWSLCHQSTLSNGTPCLFLQWVSDFKNPMFHHVGNPLCYSIIPGGVWCLFSASLSMWLSAPSMFMSARKR